MSANHAAAHSAAMRGRDGQETKGPASRGAPSPTWRIVVVDDHELIRLGIRRLIEIESDLAVCGEASGMAAALRLIRETAPNLAIVDL